MNQLLTRLSASIGRSSSPLKRVNTTLYKVYLIPSFFIQRLFRSGGAFPGFRSSDGNVLLLLSSSSSSSPSPPPSPLPPPSSSSSLSYYNHFHTINILTY